MLTTDILSLNVHDSLTFDGTELCLNPDLFRADERGGGSSQKTNPVGIGSSSTSSGNSTGTSTNASSTGMSVGDIIEIRVWDPLPKGSSRGSPALLPGSRKRFQQAPILPNATTQTNLQGYASHRRDNNLTSVGGMVEPGGVVSTLRPRTALYNMNLFQQSPPPNQIANEGSK